MGWLGARAQGCGTVHISPWNVDGAQNELLLPPTPAEPNELLQGVSPALGLGIAGVRAGESIPWFGKHPFIWKSIPWLGKHPLVENIPLLPACNHTWAV